jgi:predicted DNA-binding WGR domain protein
VALLLFLAGHFTTVLHYGRIGTGGQSKVQTLETDDGAFRGINKAEKLVRDKLRKDYSEVA